MTLPLVVLEVLVYAALVTSAVTPVALVWLLVRDWRSGKLW